MPDYDDADEDDDNNNIDNNTDKNNQKDDQKDMQDKSPKKWGSVLLSKHLEKLSGLPNAGVCLFGWETPDGIVPLIADPPRANSNHLVTYGYL